jgi:hypothetical protein
MAKHIQREPTNQVTELTVDEMERISGGLKFEMVDVKITTVPVSGGHEPVPAN